MTTRSMSQLMGNSSLHALAKTTEWNRCLREQGCLSVTASCRKPPSGTAVRAAHIPRCVTAQWAGMLHQGHSQRPNERKSNGVTILAVALQWGVQVATRPAMQPPHGCFVRPQYLRSSRTLRRQPWQPAHHSCARTPPRTLLHPCPQCRTHGTRWCRKLPPGTTPLFQA